MNQNVGISAVPYDWLKKHKLILAQGQVNCHKS